MINVHQFVDTASKKNHCNKQIKRMKRSVHDIDIWLQWQQYAALEHATDKSVIHIAKALNRIEKLLTRIHKYMQDDTNYYESKEYGKP